MRRLHLIAFPALLAMATACGGTGPEGIASYSGPVAEQSPKTSPGQGGDVQAAQAAPGVAPEQSDEFLALLAVRREMLDDRASMKAGDLRVAELRDAGADRGCFGIDVVDGPAQLTVYLPRVTDTASRWFEQRYGISPKFKAGMSTHDVGPEHPRYDEQQRGCASN